MLLLVGSTNSFAQLIAVLVIFVGVLAVTLWATRWMANYQKGLNNGRNIEVIETARIANNKWVQIVRVGDTYKALAISRDEVCYLGDVPSDQVHISPNKEVSASFSGMFEKARGELKKKEKQDHPEKLSGADSDGEKDRDSCGQ
ncbi:MAG: flagellar biosynthetic protein FliO [Lachnospiraceae bacterium]|nr:flagellar biosynthetic protein FliO [Lachnospiraceae bacterium]